MADTSIEWTDSTWNPVRGCSRVSAGCDSCYAMGQAHRFSGPGKPYEGLTILRPKTAKRPGVDWSGKVRLVPEMLSAPLRWRKPRRIFVNSMSDLFHHSLTSAEIAAVFGVMAACPQHTFQVLTKRPERAAEWCHANEDAWVFPLPNVWLGTSVENQQAADERIPWLLRCPAAVRFLSCEPLLERTHLDPWVFDRRAAIRNAMNGAAALNYEQADSVISYPLDWVIVGGESGHGARPCDVQWIRSVVEQCKASGVPVFVKQLGTRPYNRYHQMGICTNGRVQSADLSWKLNDKKGGDWSEWPEDLRVREFPEAAR